MLDKTIETQSEPIIAPTGKAKTIHRSGFSFDLKKSCHCEGATARHWLPLFCNLFSCHCEGECNEPEAIHFMNFTPKHEMDCHTSCLRHFVRNDMSKKAAFTLAEVLITLFLVGIAAVFAFQNIACGVNGSKEFECSRTYPKCDMNATRVKGVCQCNKGYYGNGTSCTACPDGKTTSRWGSTTSTQCKIDYGLSFEIVAVSNSYSSVTLPYGDTSYDDTWLGAKQYCEGMKASLPDAAQLTEMADKIYLVDEANCTKDTYNDQPYYSSCNISVINAQPLKQYLAGTNYARVWSSVPNGTYGAWARTFFPQATAYINDNRITVQAHNLAVCVR